MLAYRHAFHAGNHADVLKHLVWLLVLQHMNLKDKGYRVVDTHAGAGLYRLDSEAAQTSGEMLEGVQRLRQQLLTQGQAPCELLAHYLAVLDHFKSAAGKASYPGSPFISKHLLRPEDKLKLFELHPTDARLLEKHVEQLEAQRQVATDTRENDRLDNELVETRKKIESSKARSRNFSRNSASANTP